MDDTLDNDKIEKSIQKWIDYAKSRTDAWEGNNLHIDEISGLESLSRLNWIEVSFRVLGFIARKAEVIEPLIPFLHIDLEGSDNDLLPSSLTLEWMNRNISDITPPSFNLTSRIYYEEFYEKELKSCLPPSDILHLIKVPHPFRFFLRSYFDHREKEYSREIYVFI